MSMAFGLKHLKLSNLYSQFHYAFCCGLRRRLSLVVSLCIEKLFHYPKW